MRPSLRFLALVTLGWAGVRAWADGLVPTGWFWLTEPSEARPGPPIVPTEFPPIQPIEPVEAAEPPSAPPMPDAASYAPSPYAAPVQIRRKTVPVYYGVQSVSVPLPPPRPARMADVIRPTPVYAELPAIDEAPMSRLASLSIAQHATSLPNQSTPVLNSRAIDRFQVSAWALLRSQQTGVAGSSSLASGGNLGGSQAGARLTYAFTRQVAASFRTSSDVGRRGAEVATGVRVQPLLNIPIWITAERRERLGRFSNGRNAFAIFAEGGLYQRPMPWDFSLDAYLQGGIVGLHSRDLFVDGAAAFTRPVYKNFSAGFGVWGGAQPGLYRVDAGPRVTMQVRKNVRVHLDWRQRLAGNALPGSGPAITLAADF